MILKNQYYCFVAGLPELFFDLPKPPFSIQDFKETLQEQLASKDEKLMQSFYLSFDKDNIWQLLNNRESSIDELGSISKEEWLLAIAEIKEDEPISNKRIPKIYQDYIRSWIQSEGKDSSERDSRLWEDQLSSLYFNFGKGMKNTLIAKWFELNLNIGNILSAINCRKYGLDVAQAIVGDNEISQTIKENLNQRDFGLSLETDLYETINRLSEEKDLFERERRLDRLRWNWLEENTVFDYFNIEYIFSYLCKLHILDRWSLLVPEKGEVVFRKLIDDLKSEVVVPEEE